MLRNARQPISDSSALRRTALLVGAVSWTLAFAVYVFFGRALHGVFGHEYITAAALVAFVYVLSVAVLWSLIRLNAGRVGADSRATVKRFGGSILVAAGGLLGGFLALAFVAFMALFVLAKMMATSN